MNQKNRKWQAGLAKSRTGFLQRMAAVFKPGSPVDESFQEDLEEILIEADLGVETAMNLAEKVCSRLDGGDDISRRVREVLKEEIEMMVAPGTGSDLEGSPHVILVVGVNGTGKTTTVGKLAARYAQAGKRVILAGADTFRAAAGEQLAIWGKRANVQTVLQKTGSDPASVAFDALDAAIARGADVLLVDTAGRLHNKVNLMEELKKINRVLAKRLPGAPHEVLLVLDATTGQNGLQQAKEFTRAVGVTHVALTKLDGTARGGIAVAVFNALNIPVKWAGLGEGIDDLVPFAADNFVEGMFGD